MKPTIPAQHYQASGATDGGIALLRDYRAPAWLPGGNLQTIWAAKLARHGLSQAPAYRRERWATPDADFVDLDFSELPKTGAAAGARNLLVLFHGLEGSSRSHYALAFHACCQAAGMAYVVPHFRGCSGEINLAPRAYHSGDHQEIDWILRRLQAWWRARGGQQIVAVGISLGGNALLRWAEEQGDAAAELVSAVAAVCSPIDLREGGLAIGRGFNRLVYTRMFLRTMKPRALAKLRQFPGLFDRASLMRARDLYEFDNVFTAPLHGFRDVEDYWARASAKPHLRSIRVPALVVNALNDPFVPATSLPLAHEVGKHVVLWQPRHGGHVGFASGRLPGHVQHMPQQVLHWLLAHL